MTLIALAAGLVVAAGVYVLTLDSDDAADPGSANPDATAIDYERALAGAPPPLADLYAQGDALIEGGPEEFEAQLDELEGHPVVVNKWASWCGPCRAEFPFFSSQAEKRAGEVAFLGVDSSDNDADAISFLEEFPVPYPSYKDPDLEVADVFNGVAAFPTTAFYDEGGELVYVKQGGYASEELLAEDIERYAG